MTTRTEHDTMGEVQVPSEAYWGAQTQRSYQNFKIGGETLPQPLIYAMALVKEAASSKNRLTSSSAPLTTCLAANWTANSRSSSGRPAPARSPT